MKKSNMEELEKMFMVSHPDARPAFPLRKLLDTPSAPRSLSSALHLRQQSYFSCICSAS